MNLTHKQYDCEVIFGEYGNGNIAIQLIGKQGSEYEGQLISVPSVNGELKTAEDIVGIKTWSENTGIDKSLIEGNVIEDEILNTVTSGFVEIHYYRLTNEAMEEIKRLKEECING